MSCHGPAVSRIYVVVMMRVDGFASWRGTETAGRKPRKAQSLSHLTLERGETG